MSSSFCIHIFTRTVENEFSRSWSQQKITLQPPCSTALRVSLIFVKVNVDASLPYRCFPTQLRVKCFMYFYLCVALLLFISFCYVSILWFRLERGDALRHQNRTFSSVHSNVIGSAAQNCTRQQLTSSVLYKYSLYMLFLCGERESEVQTFVVLFSRAPWSLVKVICTYNLRWCSASIAGCSLLQFDWP